MAIGGVTAKTMFSQDLGALGTTKSFVRHTHFYTPQNVLAVPLLSSFATNGQSSIDAYVSRFRDLSQFKDSGGLSPVGHYPGVAASACTDIWWSLYCENSTNNPIVLAFYF